MLAAGCSADGGGDDPTPDPSTVDLSVTGVPDWWLTATEDGWPTSASYGQSAPIVDHRGECLILDEPPELLGHTPQFTNIGWGSYGSDLTATDAYRYLCGLWSPDNYAGQLQLIRTGNAENASQTVESFLDQPSTDVQENTVTTVTSGGLTVHVLQRWHPVPEHGKYEAIYHDESLDAIVVLEVNSLDEEQFAAYSDQQAADALVRILAEAG